MLMRLKDGHIVDPANGRDVVADLFIEDGHIVDPPADGRVPGETIDCKGLIVMAGAIDIHSHIAGGHVNTARLLLPEFHRAFQSRPGATALSKVGWTTEETGLRYAEMGFTTVVEPAMAPSSALHAHLELADIPIIDTATLVVLGNDDFLMGMIRDGESESAIADYVAWTVSASRALGVKCINAGGSAAFKENVRQFGFDDEVPDYGVSSRKIVKTLQTAVTGLGIPHPLHVHCNNLGVPGDSAAAAEATIAAAEGLPLHLAHLQFYGYGAEGTRRFSSEGQRLAELVNATKEITVDIGQVMFGQTVTVSADELRQFAGRGQAKPRKSVIFDHEANGGGVVPMDYKQSSYFNALQWAIGLELFLLIKDPSRVFFTTDHPNGAPFTAYPDIFALLMDRGVRQRWLEALPKSVLEMTILPEITREYTLKEIATMTRAAPARLLGTADRGHLGKGAIADIAVYRPGDDKAAMFGRAAYVFKDGTLVVQDGRVVNRVSGRTLSLRPEADKAMAKRLETYFDERYGLPARWFEVPDYAIGREDPFKVVPCRR
ncbi:formylmethanofuran dehydrogenase subunit A [Aurantimonas sp. C2-6-R+9]|uniref:formylmethanofuran dehydrogenase subunit A n=1 Tax=unclassified Aurantimonas TaxID=2638230 RepID=UPI002E178BE7|nr:MULTISPECIES: formylmethanofuran dehydrogenase subunit A [unclassified Aurantimonas]MEC5290322.1 formylmethanofuran dehydrogenase subunit A [Aurantimonas sp. C2-3-R2]MEC5322704.1 formylmethanofuran dehydrogenase subunit A [Aurantimonas sp. A3-2-R12]MEC5379846.1 formylmethanofuran dehydrogenase subunit A [Aurantimonas sp. C2-6-R+9]MEC5411421.1 formylmethanofuran dehydrogenase subunit A [Aurantimonas sp. C2-4-R8]